MLRQLTLCFLLLPSLVTTMSVCAQSVGNREYSMMLQKLLKHSVNEVSVNEINHSEKVIFMDARELEEYNVSHIKNAVWVGYDKFSQESLKEIPKNSKVIVYCSVGYRSEKIGEKLLEMGFSDVSNLYGGLFEWSNQQMPLVFGQLDEKTTKIHPYNKEWGKWISTGKKAYK